MNILVTGSNGFVGSRLMWVLEEKGHTVQGIDNDDVCLREKHPNTIFGDIRKIKDLEKFDNINFDLIIHCAAYKHDFGIQEKEYFSNNEYGTQVLMEYATKRNIKKVIYYGTVSEYGHASVPCDESGKLQPDNPYGESKHAGTKVIEKWQKKNSSREVIILRPSIIYGPNNFANMYNLIEMMNKKPWITIGNGSHIKSMVSLENLIEMTLFSIEKLKPGIIIYNALDKPYITVNQLMIYIAKNKGFKMPLIKFPMSFALLIGKCFDLLAKILKTDLPINSDRIRKFSTSTEYYSEKIRKDGFVQNHKIEDQLKVTCKWYLANHHKRNELDKHYKK